MSTQQLAELSKGAGSRFVELRCWGSSPSAGRCEQQSPCQPLPADALCAQRSARIETLNVNAQPLTLVAASPGGVAPCPRAALTTASARWAEADRRLVGILNAAARRLGTSPRRRCAARAPWLAAQLSPHQGSGRGGRPTSTAARPSPALGPATASATSLCPLQRSGWRRRKSALTVLSSALHAQTVAGGLQQGSLRLRCRIAPRSASR